MVKKRTHKEALEGVRKLIQLHGGRAWVLHQVGRLRGSAGIPDMLCVCRDRVFFVEVKTGSDKLRPAQADFIEHVGDRVAVVVGDAGDVQEYLDDQKREASDGAS